MNQFEFAAFGAGECKEDFISDYVQSPTIAELRKFYSSCHIWFAPTSLEGLHNVPMEAALCGCLVICGNHPRNGMLGDYVFANETAMVYSSMEEAQAMLQAPNWGLVEPMQSCIRERIGGREQNMKRFAQLLEGWR